MNKNQSIVQTECLSWILTIIQQNEFSRPCMAHRTEDMQLLLYFKLPSKYNIHFALRAEGLGGYNIPPPPPKKPPKKQNQQLLFCHMIH